MAKDDHKPSKEPHDKEPKDDHHPAAAAAPGMPRPEQTPSPRTTAPAGAPAPAMTAEQQQSEPKPEQQHPTLEPDAAWDLFYNGHKIAKHGDPQDKWISMGRLGDGTPVLQQPMTPEIEDEIKNGEYYLIDNG